MGKKFNLATHHHLANIVTVAKKMIAKEEENMDEQVAKSHLIYLERFVQLADNFWRREDSAITPYYLGQLTRIKNHIIKEKQNNPIHITYKADRIANQQVKDMQKIFDALVCDSNVDKNADFPRGFLTSLFGILLELKILKNKELNKLFTPYLNLCDNIMEAEGDLKNFIF